MRRSMQREEGMAGKREEGNKQKDSGKNTAVDKAEDSTELMFSSDQTQWTREKQYEVALAMENFNLDEITGYDEFKPSGFRYNPTKSYNRLIEMRKLTGDKTMTLSELEGSMANYNNGYYFDLSTSAGRIMYAQKMKLKGDKYIPSQDLLDQQLVETKGPEQLKKDVVNGLFFYGQVLDLIQEKIDSTKDANERNTLITKKSTLQLSLVAMTTKINEEYKRENKIEKDQNPDKPQTQEANMAIGVATLIEAIVLTLVVAGTMAYLAGLVLEGLNRAFDDLFRGNDLDLSNLRKPRTEPGGGTKPNTGTKPDPFFDPGRIPPLPPVALQEQDDCTPVPLGYHRGGNWKHDELADRVPPNLIIGTDWNVKTKSFDAWTGKPKKEIWEIKTAEYSTYTKFVKGMELNKIVADILIEKPIADACGLHYVLGVTDATLKKDLELNQEVSRSGADIRVIS
ncbi:MAG: DUF6310 domain-containing protein [Bacteroidota bacterium]|nr:DUF6310 domain-containing protein [Bacteroidota bacterium]